MVSGFVNMIDMTTRKVVNFLQMYRHAGEPEGMWEMFAGSHFGNQVFTNDSFFRWYLSSVNGEPLSDLEQIMVDLCGDAVYNDTILFEVCW